MKKLQKYLLALLLLFVAFTLVACGEQPEGPNEDEQPKEVAITSISVFPTIYDGSEDKPYVLVGQEMYVEAELNEDATVVETWEIDDATVAKMEVNPEGGVILTGLKAGNAVVTAKNADGSVKDSLTIEVCDSANPQDVLVAANAEIIAAFPKYIAANTKLPVPANPNVVIKYKNSITNGISIVNGEYQYAYEPTKGDVNKQINFTLTYHDTKLDSNTYFYEVKDAEKNVFVTVEKVEKKIAEFFAPYTTLTDGKYTPVTADFAGETAFPTEFNTEAVGGEVALTWASDTTSSISAAGKYTKGDVDKAVVLTATILIKYLPTTDSAVAEGKKYYEYKDGAYVEVASPAAADLAKYYEANTTPSAKTSVTVYAGGSTPAEVIEYFVKQKYCPADGSTVTTAIVKFATSDTSKKYAGLSVEWECDNAAAKWVASKSSYTLAAGGEYTFTGTFYYNKRFLATYLALDGKEATADQLKECDFYVTYVIADGAETGTWQIKDGENSTVVKLADYGVESSEEPKAPKNGDIMLFTLSYAWKEVRTFTITK